MGFGVRIRGIDFDPDTLTQQDLIPDPLWGKECVAFNVQVALTSTTAAQLAKAAAQLDAAVPHQRATPQSSLHVFVVNLVHSRSPMGAREKEALWRAHERDWLQVIDNAAKASDPFDIHLAHLVPAPGGILIAAANCAGLVALRADLMRGLGMKAEAVPELGHVTLMRYGPRPPSAGSARNAIQALDVRVTAHVAVLRTVRERVYPSLMRDTIRHHALGGERQES